jgi:hypothetical protein
VAVPPSGIGESDLRREDPLIFVSDASAEAERLTAALRARGYQVVDVPLTLLVGRVAVQRPALILCDVDAEGALETTHRLRDIPGGAGVDIIFIGEAGRTLDDMADAVFHEGSGFFVRPVDVFSLLHKAEALIGPPANAPGGGSIVPSGQRGPVRISSHPPQRRTPSQPPEGSDSRPPSAPPSRPPSNPPPGRIVASASRSPSSPPAKTPSAPPARAPSSPPQLPNLPGSARGAEREPSKASLARQIPQAEISPELELLLQRAEQRVGKVTMSSAPPSFRLDPEAEVDAILPADVLAALDEPLELDDDDDDESSASVGTRTGSEAGRTASGTAASTAAGSTAIGGVPTMLGQRTASGTQGTGVPIGTQPPPPDPDPAASAAAPATSSGAEPAESAAAAAAREILESEPPPTPPAVPTRPPSAPSWPPPSSIAAEAVGLALHPAALAATTPPLRPPSQDEAARAATTAADRAIRRMTEPSTTPPRGREVPPTEPPVASDELDPSSEPALEIPATLGALDAFRALAKAIRSRYTGALAFEEPAGIRRVVLRDGDFVTAASGADTESLAAFLGGRGDLSPEAARQARKLPQFGRHAGAALIAHGHLRQDDLWPVLRAHAEWILGRIANMSEGSASVERQIPPRLQAEPAVFGGATGAEVLVEIARRTISPDQAIRRLGGPSAQLVAGSAGRLLGECALPDTELMLVEEAKITPLSELLPRALAPEFASVLFALLELGVLAVAPGRRVDLKPAAVHDELDDEALRARILTRKALVDDGDYFALLGVGRAATAYDIRRAYAALRREFEPSRILGATTADLRDDVDVIIEVLEEAYDILRDERRRDRYRRALEANPR